MRGGDEGCEEEPVLWLWIVLGILVAVIVEDD